jgi:dihydroneopterin aldolase
MTRIGLEGMEFYAFHGYYEAERKIGNKYLLDVFVTLNNELKGSDHISDTVNYEDIYEICQEEMKIPRKLIETVSYSIISRLKAEKNNIAKVDLKLMKVGVQLGGKVEQSVIEYSG